MFIASHRSMITIASRDDEFTRGLGAALARTLPTPPRRSLRIFLRGDLGVGKTTFVRGLLQGMGETRTVKSPTYSLLETYEHSPWHVVHLDLYRLVEPCDLDRLELSDHDYEGTLWLIEWPERGEGALPQPDLDIFLESRLTGPLIRLVGQTPIAEEWLRKVSKESEFSSAGR
ncbi:MAG: tRNA (adenosine(37)-N6)-threonylcarbamoyltransferase complex ATPase subunit type 1 TsaE [Gammaproteobacteria bacterium]|nr:tRNA (adenosine(37)-N6)-threonylcarbamoyltransferase complex ATPase subunit type 1 TsaE [Gammaproteobacteria bacterium]